MSQYFKAKAVRAKGQPADYRVAGQQPEIPAQHRLIALLDNGAYEKAVDVTDPEEFQTFYDLDCQGHYLHFLLYALPEEFVAECV